MISWTWRQFVETYFNQLILNWKRITITKTRFLTDESCEEKSATYSLQTKTKWWHRNWIFYSFVYYLCSLSNGIQKHWIFFYSIRHFHHFYLYLCFAHWRNNNEKNPWFICLHLFIFFNTIKLNRKTYSTCRLEKYFYEISLFSFNWVCWADFPVHLIRVFPLIRLLKMIVVYEVYNWMFL